MIELLAPAGDLEKLKIAFLYGADACYIGGKEYSLRANAKNFSIEEIKEACLFAHKLNKKIYVTVNMVFHNEDIEGLALYLKELKKANVDAIIVSDPLVLSVLKENNIPLEVHLSTQSSTTNIESVKYWMSQGVKRIVLARELSACEIKEIIEKTGCDIEVFLHGAMCTCYSGRCVLSNFITNRDSNRGGCAQVCRFTFDLDKKRETDYSIATKDLNLSKYINDLIEMKVVSIKIEGRMRSAYYVATIISCYRKLIDAYYNNNSSESLVKEIQKKLDKVANRTSTTQYFKGNATEDDQYYIGRCEISNQDYLGIVIGYDKENKAIILEERNFFKKKDKVVIFTPEGDEHHLTLSSIYDEDMNELEQANHPKQIIKIKYDVEIPKNSMMRVNF